MGVTQITIKVSVNGQSVNPTSLHLANEGATAGVINTGDQSIVVASGEAFVSVSTGILAYSFTDPVGVTQYEAYLKSVYQGITDYYTLLLPKGTTTVILSFPNLTYFSSETEVLRLLGKFGIDMALEDWTSGSKGSVWEDILSYVDETLTTYLSHIYDITALRSNKYLRRRATILAANLLSQRRGNPALYAREANRVFEELDSIRLGNRMLPGAAQLGNFGPVVRNYVTQPNTIYHQRVQRNKSTGDSYEGERFAMEPYWAIGAYD